MSIGITEVLLIALVVLVLFGGGRLGAIGKGLGEGIRNFKKGISGDDSDSEPPKEPPQLPAKPSAEPSAESETREPETAAKSEPK
jgi:sec-independent protein translocase protein TatA